MKSTGRTPAQIIHNLKTAEQIFAQGKTIADVRRALEGSQPTYHRWHKHYTNVKAK